MKGERSKTIAGRRVTYLEIEQQRLGPTNPTASALSSQNGMEKSEMHEARKGMERTRQKRERIHRRLP